MAFAEGLNKVCKEKGTTPTALLKSMGLSTSKVTMWNNGSLPKEEIMVALAKQLGCSVMDFFMDETDAAPADDDEIEIITTFRKLDRKARHEFMAMVYDFDKRVELAGE